MRRCPGSRSSNRSCKLRPEHAGSGVCPPGDRCANSFPRGFLIGRLVFAVIFAVRFALKFGLLFGLGPIAIPDASAGDSSSRANARRSAEHHHFATGCYLDHGGASYD